MTQQEELAEEIRLAKAEGVWVDGVADLLPKPGPDENAATAYLEACRLTSCLAPLPNGIKVVDLDKWSHRKIIKQYLSKLEPGLDLVSKAAKRPHAVFDINYATRDIDLDGLKAMRSFAKAFLHKANLRTRDGQLHLATNDLEVAARIARHVGQGVLSINILVQMAITKLICSELERICTLQPQMASQVDGLFEALGPAPDIVLAQHAELAYCADLIAADEKKNDATHEGAFIKSIRTYRLFLQRAAGKETPSEIRDAIRSAVNDADSAGQFPFIEKVMHAQATTIAARRVCRQGMAVLASRGIPDELPLKGEWAVDPSTNEPLGYLRTKDGFEVFAAGLTAESAAIMGPQAESNIVFEYPANPKARRIRWVV